MNLQQIARLILTREMAKINESTRVEIIRLVLSARKRVVQYRRNQQTPCPVCSYFEIAGDVIVIRTTQDVRYCECRRCTANFTAANLEWIDPQETKEDLTTGTPDTKKKAKKAKHFKR
jgi:formate dehydrogenase maturation protein FdhE